MEWTVNTYGELTRTHQDIFSHAPSLTVLLECSEQWTHMVNSHVTIRTSSIILPPSLFFQITVNREHIRWINKQLSRHLQSHSLPYCASRMQWTVNSHGEITRTHPDIFNHTPALTTNTVRTWPASSPILALSSPITGLFLGSTSGKDPHPSSPLSSSIFFFPSSSSAHFLYSPSIFQLNFYHLYFIFFASVFFFFLSFSSIIPFYQHNTCFLFFFHPPPFVPQLEHEEWCSKIAIGIDERMRWRLRTRCRRWWWRRQRKKKKQQQRRQKLNKQQQKKEYGRRRHERDGINGGLSRWHDPLEPSQIIMNKYTYT